MPLALTPLVEYLAAQRRTSPTGTGRIALPNLIQYNVPYIPPATATVRSMFSISTGPGTGDVCAIAWHISSDKRVPPDVLQVSIVQGGYAVTSMRLTSDHIEDGLSTFLFIGQDDFLRWDIENLSLLPAWFVGSLWTLSVSTLDDLAQVKEHVYAYARGPYYRRNAAQYGRIDFDYLAAQFDQWFRWAAASGHAPPVLPNPARNSP